MTSTLAGYTVSIPAAAPTVAVGSTAGSMAAGNYAYNVTFVTGFGETTGAASSNTVSGVPSSGSVAISAIPVSTNGNVYQRKLYRTAVGASGSFFLLATIGDNLTTTYTDTLNDTSITSNPTIPASNTASSREIIQGTLSTGSPLAFSVENGITATAGGGQTNAYLLTKEYSIITTVGTAADSVKLPLLNTNLIGLRMVIVNDVGTAAAIFPNTGQTITVNAGTTGGANASISLGANARTELIAKSATGWEQVR